MIRARGAKCRSLLVVCVAGCGLALGPAAVAVAAPAASEEYILSLPGVDKTTVGNTTVDAGPSSTGGEGVVGEQNEPDTPAGVLGSSLLSVTGMAILAPALALTAFGLLRRRSRQGQGI